MKLIFSLLFLYVATFKGAQLFSEQPLSPFDGDPRGVIHEVVDAVSGKFGLVEEDLSIKGPEPFSVTRIYRDGWYFFPHTRLTIHNKEGVIRADTYAPNGMPISFSAGKVSSLPAGYVNSKTLLHASTNAYNCTFENNKIVTEDGTVRLYQPVAVSDSGPFCTSFAIDTIPSAGENIQMLLLQKEILPNGNERVYSYNDAGQLSKIVLQSAQAKREFGWIAFSYSKNRMVVSCSNEAFAFYHFEFDELQSVQRSQKADVSYSYCNKKLEQIRLNGAPFLRVSYTKEGKVQALFTANVPTPLYTFEYAPQETRLLDASQNRKLFRSRGNRLAWLEDYEKETLCQTTALYWGSGTEECRLLGYAIRDEKGTYERAARFTYDQVGNVVTEQLFCDGEIQFDSDLLPISGKRVATTHFSFNRDAFHTIVKQVQPNGDELRLDYKAGTNLLAQVILKPVTGEIVRALYTYNSDGERIKEVVDKSGCGKIVETIIQPGMHQKSVKWFQTVPLREILLNRTKCYFDKKHNLIREEFFDRNGNFSSAKNYSYDAHQNVTSIKNNEGATLVSTVYDEQDRSLRSYSLADSCSSTYSYNQAGCLKKITQRFPERRKCSLGFEWDLVGNLVATTDEYNNPTKYRLDCFGRRLACIKPAVMTGSHEKVCYITDLGGPTVFNRFPLYLSKRLFFQEALPDLASPYKKPDCEYDALWRVVRKKKEIDDKTALYECCKYDSEDRVIESWIEQDGTKHQHLIFSFDAASNLLTTSNENGIIEERTYLNNRLASIRDSAGSITSFEYDDSCINQLQQRVHKKIIRHPNGALEHIQYDALFREEEKWMYDEAGVLLQHERFSYDCFDNVVTKDHQVLPSDILKPTVVRTESLYSDTNRLLSRTEAVGSSSARKTAFSYNEKGKIAAIIYPDQQTKSFEYDAQGGLERVLLNNSPVAEVQSDEEGRITDATLSNGVRNSRAYTADGLLVSDTVSLDSLAWTVGYQYDRLGRVTALTLPDKSGVRFIYKGFSLDAVLRVSAKGAELYRVSEETPAQFESCFYEKIIERDVMGQPTTIERNGESFQRSFDAMQRISRERSPRNIAYVYDSQNNMLKCGGRRFSYNIFNQLEHESGTSYSYDRNGHLASIVSVHSEKKFTYDQDGHLQQYEKEGEQVTFLTDFFGRRVARKEGDEIAFYLYIGQTEIGSFDKDGKLLDLKIPRSIENERADGCAAVELQGVAYFALSDSDGNVACLINVKTGQKAESYSYTSLGEESILGIDGARVDDTVIGNPWRFQASRKDPVTGLVQLNGRDHIPGVSAPLRRKLPDEGLKFVSCK